jgi:hypothetical protein
MRVKATIDRDSVSPDAIRACATYLTNLLERRSENQGIALNWNTWRSYQRRDRHGDLVIIQWARVFKS